MMREGLTCFFYERGGTHFFNILGGMALYVKRLKREVHNFFNNGRVHNHIFSQNAMANPNVESMSIVQYTPLMAFSTI